MTGAGPSRRSHTKSRTGCKTCKRRHIRCDETVPQCRNCTKHQVRCDYMDDSPGESAAASPLSSPEVSAKVTNEAEVYHWRQNGVFPFPGLNIEHPPRPESLTDVELRLLYHLCSICNDLRQTGTSALTIWTERIPKFVSLAADFPFLLQALCSFSATHLAWKEGSPELRGLQAEHGGTALRGLHEAIGSFSQANADAILAASMLMSWQATDWLSWSSLTAGTSAVLHAMPSWSRSKFLKDYFPQDGLTVDSFRVQPKMPLNVEERGQVLNNVAEALQKAQVGLSVQDMEAYWIDQLLSYVKRLRRTSPAQSPELQFEHAYMLRKWAFWVPITLLQRDTPKGPATITLAHLYATIIALQPLFPDLLGLFQSVMVMPPLETIIDLTDSMSRQGDGPSAVEIGELLRFARQVAYDQTFSFSRQGLNISRQSSSLSSHSDSFHDLISVTDLSPAFAPSVPSMMRMQSDMGASNHLNVPMDATGFSYGVSTWGMAPSPGFPPQDFGADLLDLSGSDLLDSQAGFVNAIPIWV